MISILFVIMNVDQGGHLTDFLYKYIQEFALYAHACARGLSRLVERMLSDNRSPSSNPSHCLFVLQQNNFSTIIIDAKTSGVGRVDPTDRKAWKAAIKEMKCPTPQSGTNGL